jgi:CheY-like chemotaxis protein
MSIKVLVADDSITIQKVIGIIFSGDEYSLTVVDNGKTAVDKAREINPDILLIDALMPGMTGYEVAEVVRSTPALATKPILILTGSFEPFDEDKAKKCGADDFISKPFESQQILAKVKELLELGATRGTTMAAQAPPQPAAEPVSVQAPPVAPVFDVPAPAPVADPVAEQLVEAPADIWGAFTTPEPAPVVEPSAPAFSAPAATATEPAAFEPDVFAIVSEENDSQLIPSAAAVTETAPSHTGSQWVPVEENTFEFEDTVDEPAAPVQEVSMTEASFGDISFEDDVTAPVVQPDFTEPVAAVLPEPAVPEADLADFAAPPAAPVFETFEVPAAPVEPFAPLADPAPACAPAAEPAPVTSVAASVAVAPASAASLTEDQLKQALASVSKDVIERIVWEVVPDLAEALIKEAIRKIKEGN